MMERAFFGPRRERFDHLTDASLIEAVPLGVMVIAIVGVGVYPAILTDVFRFGLEPMIAVLPGGG